MKLMQFILIIALIISIISSSLAAYDFNQASFMLLLISCVLLIYAAYLLTRNWVSISVIFTVFFLLYGLSGPFAVLFTPGRLPSPFYPPYHVGPWLQSVNLAFAGIVLGFFMGSFMRTKNLLWQVPFKSDNWISRDSFWVASLFLIVIASMMNWINIIRIGGIAYPTRALLLKTIGELFFTLPGDYYVYTGMGALGLWWAKITKNHITKKRLIISLILFLPFIVYNVLIGERGNLFSAILSFFIGYSLVKPFQVLSIRIIIIVIIAYIINAFIMTHRTYIFRWLSKEGFFMIDKDTFYLRLNPGFLEFSVSFGTFNAYLNNWDSPPLYGQTYWTDLLTLIPRWLYPGEKPKSISSLFHEQIYGNVFAHAHRTLGVGVGSSAIAVAHANFREPGIFFVYFLITTLIVALERKVKICPNLFWLLFYVTIAPAAIVWNRVSHIYYYLFYGIISIFVFKFIMMVTSRLQR